MNGCTVIFTSCDTVLLLCTLFLVLLMTTTIELCVFFLPFFLTCIPMPCMFGDNVSALELTSLSQVFQEALISSLCNNGINYF